MLVETLESAALALLLSVAGNLVIALFGDAKSLDTELRTKIQHRDLAIAEKDQKLQQQEQKIQALR